MAEPAQGSARRHGDVDDTAAGWAEGNGARALGRSQIFTSPQQCSPFVLDLIESFSDSPFFLLKPKGISTGDMFELHYNVDPKHRGGRVPVRFGGGGWSGKVLGWEKYDRPGRLWYGAPTPLKAVAGGGVVGTGAFVDQIDGEEWADENPTLGRVHQRSA